MNLFLYLTIRQFIAALYLKIVIINLKNETKCGKLSRRLNPDNCQRHQHKIDCPTPDSYQTQILPDLTIVDTIALFAFLAARVATDRT
jgi:hypothetical protein